MQNLFSILKRPVVTERTTSLKALANQYVFHVSPNSNKYEIKAAIEKAFKVKVKAVRTINVTGKTRRLGKAPAGARLSWKKAIITVEKGQEIKFVEEPK